MSQTTWVKRSPLGDGEHQMESEVDIPNRRTIRVEREVLERLLFEAGYAPKEQ